MKHAMDIFITFVLLFVIRIDSFLYNWYNRLIKGDSDEE